MSFKFKFSIIRKISLSTRKIIVIRNSGNYHKPLKKHIDERDIWRSLLITPWSESIELIPLWRTIFHITRSNLLAFPHIRCFQREILHHVVNLTTPMATFLTSKTFVRVLPIFFFTLFEVYFFVKEKRKNYQKYY